MIKLQGGHRTMTWQFQTARQRVQMAGRNTNVYRNVEGVSDSETAEICIDARSIVRLWWSAEPEHSHKPSPSQ